MLWQANSGLICGRGALDAAGAPLSPSAAFLARTSGLDGTHVTAYTNLIDGLVTDGVWTKLDFLHIYATQDSTTAKLNLVSTSYTVSVGVSSVFTADRGYTGQDNSTSAYIDTTFNPSTASSPNYVQNSAHISAWSVTNITNSDYPIMGAQNAGGPTLHIYPKYDADNKAYFRINDNNSLAGVSNADSSGHYICNRSSSSAVQGYRNGSSILSSGSDTSNGVPSVNIYSIANHTDSGGQNVFGSSFQQACDSCGSSLNSTDAGNLYTRLRTYMTAVGVP